MGNYSLFLTSCSLLLVLLSYNTLPRQLQNRFYDFSFSPELVSDIISHNTVSFLVTGDFNARNSSWRTKDFL